MAYPGFQRGDANSILPNVLINHMKMKKIGPGGRPKFYCVYPPLVGVES